MRQKNPLGFPDKQNTQGVSSAVGGDGAAGSGQMDFSEGGCLLNLGQTCLDDFLIAACMGHKNVVQFNAGNILQLLGNVLLQNIRESSPVKMP